MPNPKKRHTGSSRNMRRAMWRIPYPTVVECSQCHSFILPHQVCPTCGYYGGRMVMVPKEKGSKEKEKKE
jgi:large subunit ribosomal protein L32